MFLFIAAPWFIFMYATFGDVFLQRHFLFNLSGGAAGGQNFAPLQWYGIYMLDRWKPLVFLIPVIIYTILSNIQKRNFAFLIPLLWILSIFVPFSVSSAKVWWYIYPLWPAFLLLLGYALQNIEKTRIMLLAMLLVLMSIVPYWQLTVSHIPLKPFLLLTLISTGFMFFANKFFSQKSWRWTYSLFLTILGATALLHWHTDLSKNPSWNTHIKTLASRNQGLTKISVLGMPYESALFYFNSGNVQTDITRYDKDNYLILKDGWVPLDLNKFMLIDKEADIFLYKRVSQ
ncbi:MAG: hypothetical protein UZ22_OP11002000142 [Microgenomates bacterium OLB23]|nr:MAG: hypothetical protein UZ22_OP11002000142 [Microgenomates bacterium OLB23]